MRHMYRYRCRYRVPFVVQNSGQGDSIVLRGRIRALRPIRVTVRVRAKGIIHLY